MLIWLFTLFIKIKRELLVAWETAHFHAHGGVVPDGLCAIGHAIDDHMGREDEDLDEGEWIYTIQDEEGNEIEIDAASFWDDDDDDE